MNWISSVYSKTQVKNAGKLIGSGAGSKAELDEAREKVSNFRSSHAYPLYSVTNHVRNHAIAVSDKAIIARRLKRLPTIVDKLSRHPHMNVTTMHDLGGCRVVLPTFSNLTELAARLQGPSRAKNQIVRVYDYIEDPGPQNTGYRGIHLVYEYHASKKEFAGARVEVQIRTSLQHAWATAIETLDLFGGTRLKYGEGENTLKRYFLIVSSLMALDEGSLQPAGATGGVDELRGELRALEASLGVLTRLRSYVAIVESFGKEKRNTFVLELHRKESKLYLHTFKKSSMADLKLEEIESRGDENIDAVLVASQKVSTLQSAYPNYFADSTAFVKFVKSQT